MNIVSQFDPSATTSGTFNVTFPGNAGKMVIYNESNISLQLSFSNSDTTYVPAWTAMLYCISGLTSPVVTWQQLIQLAANIPPTSQVIVETFEQNETVPGTYPAALVRQTNLGNAVPLATSANSVQNDGNVSGTSIVEATQSGAPSSTVSIDNAGNVLLKQYVAATLTTLVQIIAGAANGASNIKLSDISHVVEVIGSLLVDHSVTVAGNLQVQGGQLGVHTSADLIDCTAAPDIYIKNPNGGAIHFQSPNGTSIATLDTSGNLIIKGSLTQHGTP